MDRLQQEKHFLIALSKANEKKQLSLLRKASSNQLKVVCEILLNCEKFELICKAESGWLRRYKSKIRKLIKSAKTLTVGKLRLELLKESSLIVRIVGFTLQKLLESTLSLLFSNDNE